MEQPTKTCRRCGDSKPLDAFNKDSSSKDGKFSWCRDCQAEYRKTYYATNRDREVARSRAWNLAHPDAVRATDKRRYERDTEKRLRSNRQTYAKHREAYQAQQKARRDGSLEAYRERERLWRAENKDSIAERKRRYRKENPNVRLQEKAKFHRRRASMASGTVTAEGVRQRMAYYGGRCWICGAEAQALDHVKPLSKGGTHYPCNLRPACTACNSRKRDKWMGVERIDELKEWVLARA